MEGYAEAMAEIRREADKTIDALNMQEWDSGVAQLKYEAMHAATSVYLAMLDDQMQRRQLDDGAAYIKARISEQLRQRGFDVDFDDDCDCDCPSCAAANCADCEHEPADDFCDE